MRVLHTETINLQYYVVHMFDLLPTTVIQSDLQIRRQQMSDCRVVMQRYEPCLRVQGILDKEFIQPCTTTILLLEILAATVNHSIHLISVSCPLSQSQELKPNLTKCEKLNKYAFHTIPGRSTQMRCHLKHHCQNRDLVTAKNIDLNIVMWCSLLSTW